MNKMEKDGKKCYGNCERGKPDCEGKMEAKNGLKKSRTG